MSALQTLALAGNQIGDAGLVALCEPLSSLATLTLSKLDLSSNRVGDVGAAALSRVLEVLGCLESLYLGANRIGEAGANALAAALTGATRTSLTHLYFNQHAPQLKLAAEARGVVFF